MSRSEDHAEVRLGLRFYPEYLLEILVVAVIVLEIVVALAFLSPAVLGRRIDLVGPFSPRPEWYFLWLYELVKYFPGATAVIGTVLIPGLALGTLVFIPWLDRDGQKKWFARGIWACFMIFASILTALSFRDVSW